MSSHWGFESVKLTFNGQAHVFEELYRVCGPHISGVGVYDRGCSVLVILNDGTSQDDMNKLPKNVDGTRVAYQIGVKK